MHDLLFIVYAFLALFLLLLASSPHFKSGNIGACMLVVWSFIGTLGFLVNAITWWDNVGDHTPIWCDIWVKLHVGMGTGISSACLCINRRLAIISSAKRSNVSAKNRRWSFWVDLAIGILPSLFAMAISYTRQANRYTISEGFGCSPATYFDVYGVLAVPLLPLLIGVISFIYGAVAIYNFTSRRMQFQTVLKQNGGGLNTSRFFRLVALSSVEMLVSVPVSAYTVTFLSRDYLQPIESWSSIHFDWYRVDMNSGSTTPADAKASLISFAQRWIPVFAAFAYFTFFGMQDEALTAYQARAIWAVRLPRRALDKIRGRRSSSSMIPSTAHLPNLGSAIAPVSPSTAYFPGRSADDLEHGGLSLKMTEDGEKDGSLGHKPSGIAVRVERSVV